MRLLTDWIRAAGLGLSAVAITLTQVEQAVRIAGGIAALVASVVTIYFMVRRERK